MPPDATEFAIFPTTIGCCGIVWRGGDIRGVQLPEASDSATRARLGTLFPEAREAAPPDRVARTIDGIVDLLDGKVVDLSGVNLDMEGVPPFHRRVYAVVRAIPPGSTLAYGEVAARAGSPGSARAVGRAMAKNPFAPVVPCHRVLAAGGRTGGFSASGGIITKMKMLAIEGAPGAQPTSPVAASPYPFDPTEAIAHLRAKDPTLAQLIDTVGPFQMKLHGASSVFGALAETIVHQQLTAKAASTIFERVRGLFPRSADAPTAQQILRVPEEELREAGLSRAKTLALKDLAARELAGSLPTLAEAQRMSDEEIVERLVVVRGIGRWTAQMFLVFRLGRPDVLAGDDYGLRKGFQVAYGERALPERAALEMFGTRWRPFRTVASWYLWRASELASGPRG